MDVLQRDDLPFPRSLPEFQQLFPDEAKCAAYMEKARWGDGFVCPHCHAAGDPFRIATRPGVLRCRKCRHDTGLTVGTVMERSHMPLSTWFSYLVDAPGIKQLPALGLRIVRAGRIRIGGKPGEHVETIAATGVHHKVLVACAVDVIGMEKIGWISRNHDDGVDMRLERAGDPEVAEICRSSISPAFNNVSHQHLALSSNRRFSHRFRWNVRTFDEPIQLHVEG